MKKMYTFKKHTLLCVNNTVALICYARYLLNIASDFINKKRVKNKLNSFL